MRKYNVKTTGDVITVEANYFYTEEYGVCFYTNTIEDGEECIAFFPHRVIESITSI